ncbi:MAG TPA: ABC transporter permease [Vicinamibacterales bacterium]
MWASPGFTLFAIGSLAVGIGVTTAIYSAVRTLLWMPLGVPHADELVTITNGQFGTISLPDFEDLQRSQTVFRNLGAELRIRTAAAGPRGTETVFGLAVSADYFSMTGVRPTMGRLLDVNDATLGAAVTVVSERLWRTNLGGDPAAIGQTIRLGGQPFEIVGVTSGDFHGLEPDPLPYCVWIPLAALGRDAQAFGAPSEQALNRRSYADLIAFGRLKPGVTLDQATAQARVIGEQIDRAYPSDASRIVAPRQWIVRRPRSTLGGGEAVNTLVISILVAIATLLLIACTNLANLALARGTARAQETAVRSALGASRWRLVREQLVESAMVVTCGGALGLAILTGLVSYWTVDIPMGYGDTIPFAPQVDVSVLIASAAAMLIAVVVFGVWPALQSTRSDVRDALGAGHGATSPKWRMHRNIIAWQVSGSVALLLVAFLCAKVVAGADHEHPSARHDQLALADVEFSLNGKDEAQMRRLAASILDDVRAQRGVRNASASNGVPFGLWMGRDRIAVTTPDRASEPPTSPVWSQTTTIAVMPGFFATVGIPLTHGRSFNEQDEAAAPAVAIVSEEFARETFRTTDVVGRTLATRSVMRAQGRSVLKAGSLTIVGVSADDEPWGNGRAKSLIFVPFAQRYQPSAPVTFTVNATDARAGVAALRASIRRVDPDLSISSAGTGTIMLDGPLFLLRAITAMAAALGALALVLAMAGLFGVLSHVVTKRTREMGIRLAIGAERGDIFRLIVRDGLHPVGKGLLLGLSIGVGARIAVKTFVETMCRPSTPGRSCCCRSRSSSRPSPRAISPPRAPRASIRTWRCAICSDLHVNGQPGTNGKPEPTSNPEPRTSLELEPTPNPGPAALNRPVLLSKNARARRGLRRSAHRSRAL